MRPRPWPPRDTKLELIFLEASDASLVSRFSETRHRHPLEATRSGVQASIAEERRRLARTRELADHVIDTSGLSIGQLKDRLFAVMPRASVSEELRIDIVTFGFKYGIPLEADLVFDVRFLTNPYWDPQLKPLSGLEEPVRDFVLGQPSARRFLELVTELLELTVPAYRAEGKEQLRVALGCTGGYHRSIALAEELRSRLAKISGRNGDRLPPGAGTMKGPRLPRWLYPGHAPEALAGAAAGRHRHPRAWRGDLHPQPLPRERGRRDRRSSTGSPAPGSSRRSARRWSHCSASG